MATKAEEKSFLTQESDKTPGLRLLFKNNFCLAACQYKDLHPDSILTGWTEWVFEPEIFGCRIMREIHDDKFEDPLTIHAGYVYLTEKGGDDEHIEEVFKIMKEVEEQSGKDTLKFLVQPYAECWTCGRVAIADFLKDTWNTVIGYKYLRCTTCVKEKNSRLPWKRD